MAGRLLWATFSQSLCWHVLVIPAAEKAPQNRIHRSSKPGLVGSHVLGRNALEKNGVVYMHITVKTSIPVYPPPQKSVFFGAPLLGRGRLHAMVVYTFFCT